MSESKGGVTTDKGCFYAKHETKFYTYNMQQLKAMVAHADPGKVKEIAENWKWIHDTLVGEDGRGGLRKEFDDAVKEVLEHWGGKAAEAFRQRANTISQNIGNSAPYASNMRHVMNGVGQSLSEYKQKIDDMEMPTEGQSNRDAVGNYALKVVTFGAKGGRDDSKAIHELEQGKDTTDVLNGNSGELSEGKERQLQTAIMMEYLGSAYRSNAQAIGKPPGGGGRDGEVPERGDTLSPPPFVPLPDGVVNRPKPSTPKGSLPSSKGPGYTSPGDLEAPRQRGISGGVGSATPPKMSTLPNVGTGLDGFSGGGPGGGSLNSGGGTSGLGGGGSLNGAGGGAGHVSGGGSGPTGMPGGGMTGGSMTGRSGGTGGGVAGAGARSGRGGAPGMGGAPGAGAGAKGTATGRGGALARQKGGVVGATGGKSGVGGQGGSGLHRSRGGTQAGAGGGQRPMGAAGMPGAHGGKGKDKGPNGERPDYLVEDEETWTPERNVAPKVIE
ncbi:WXG100 family type VII secretion target [Streptomyces sp. NPDC018045]|uniref:WXG100 family type VII secretion target n=1 Tax=Streptomyces sp. NPDC018045 TaxID=3365037 RepID=UPI00378BA4C8